MGMMLVAVTAGEPDAAAGAGKTRTDQILVASVLSHCAGSAAPSQVLLPGAKRPRVSVTDATVYKNFYLLRLPDGSETDVAEDAFGIVESAAAEAIRSLVDHATWPIPSRVRQDLAGWAALQAQRSDLVGAGPMAGVVP